MDLRRLPSTRLFKIRPQLPFAIIPPANSEEDSLIEKTDWEPGHTDIQLPELRTESATFDPASSDNELASKPVSTLVDVPDLGSCSRLLVGLFVLVTILSSTTMILAMLDAPFAPQRAEGALPEYHRKEAISGLPAQRSTRAQELAEPTEPTGFPADNFATELLQDDWDTQPDAEPSAPRDKDNSTTHER